MNPAIVENGTLMEVPIGLVRANPVSLRSVDRDSEQFQGLVKSMKVGQFLGAITCRELVDTSSGEKYYEIIDGLHRWTAAREAGLETIKIDVHVLTDIQVIERQIQMNVHNVPTKPIEYTKGIRLILDHNGNITVNELAARLGKSAEFINERLSLLKITDEGIRKLIDDGAIKLGNAVLLAKLPPSDHAAFRNDACILTQKEFEEKVAQRMKANRESAAAGKDSAPAEWVPGASMRKLADIKIEVGIDGKSAGTGAAMKALLKPETTPAEAFQLALQWAISLDPISVKQKKADHEKQVAVKAEAAKAKKEESLQKQELSADHKRRIGNLEYDLIIALRNNKITEAEANAQRAALKAAIEAEKKAFEKAEADAKAKQDAEDAKAKKA